MEIGVRYLSKFGHTKDIAESIAEELNVNAISIIDENKLDKKYDILFLGGAPYANVMDKSLREYANDLTKEDVNLVVLFTTSNFSKRTVNSLKKILTGKGIKVSDEYFYAQMLRIKTRIPEAKKFARKIKEEYK